MRRVERQRKAHHGLLAFALADPELYDELADAGDLRDSMVDAVDAALAEKGDAA